MDNFPAVFNFSPGVPAHPPMTGGVTILPGLSPASIRGGDGAVKSARISGVEDFTYIFPQVTSQVHVGFSITCLVAR